jgi:class 3 adenylate cyclase/YHS domain-containing protein
VATGADHVKSSTFVFADLAGFTALTEAHGDDSATTIAGDFAGAVRKILAEYDAEEVKTIGDEVMIRVADPNTAVRLGTRIVDELAFHGSPPVRVGMHSGPAIHRDGDWFGATVNLASRVADAAHPGEVLLTSETRKLLDQANGFELEDGGARYFKHVPELIPVYRAAGRSTGAAEFEIDPVCRMAVARDRADSMRKRRGIAYYFCSAECRRQFDQNPRRYVAMSPAARAARKGFLINFSAFLLIGGAHLIYWAARGFSLSASHGMFVLFAAWAIALAVHYRAVRSVI